MFSSSFVLMRILLLVGNLSLVAGAGGGFLDKRFGEEFQGDLQNILSQTLGRGHGVEEQQLLAIENDIKPIFNVLPKNYARRVSAAVMRHAVHRYFSVKHGWQVKGFEPHIVGEESERAPNYVDDVLEQKLYDNGFSLQDVVTVVAVVERMVGIERSKAVEGAFSLYDKVATRPITEETLAKVIHSYMVVEMIDGSTQGYLELDKKEHFARLKDVAEIYPYWSHTQMHLDDLVHSSAYVRQQTIGNPFTAESHTFAEANKIAKQVSENFALWSNYECRGMTETLQEMDPFGRGRVRLTDFYQKSGSAWQFRESVAYLRSIGALDESSPALGPQVIIPNYVLGMANCITSTPYFSVCCVNQCLPFLQKIEEIFKMPEVPAAMLADVVSDLSYTLGEPKNISKHLFARLEQIAEMNHGMVPLHGRLFSQWLHFTFPRECPYPHLSGTTQPATVEEYELKAGENSATVTEHDAEALAQEAGNSKVTDFSQSAKAGESAWEMKEELLPASTPSDSRAFDTISLIRIFAGICLFLGFGRMGMHMFQDALALDKTRVKKAIL